MVPSPCVGQEVVPWRSNASSVPDLCWDVINWHLLGTDCAHVRLQWAEAPSCNGDPLMLDLVLTQAPSQLRPPAT